jgi:hypothetical protein
MKPIVFAILLSLPVLLAYGADEGGKHTSDNQAASEQAKDNTPKKEHRVSETFTPSEEISEDLSVPFPVDI